MVDVTIRAPATLPKGRSSRAGQIMMSGVIAVSVVVIGALAGCTSADPGPPPTTSPAAGVVTASPGARLSGDEFWASLPIDVQQSICEQVGDDRAAALDIAASYAAANPVFRSQLVATIRAECR